MRRAKQSLKQIIKQNKWEILISLIIILLPIIVGIMFWNEFPEQMATHWGIDGNADGWCIFPESAISHIMVGAMLVLVVVLIVYSYWYYRKQCGEGKIPSNPIDGKKKYMRNCARN